MAMNYTEASTLERNSWFRDRVQVSVSTYTNYLLNTPTDDPDYDSKTAAGTRMAQQYQTMVSTLVFTLSGDSEVQAAGPAIPDPQLQSIVEKTINKLWPVGGSVAPGGFAGPYVPPPPVRRPQ